MDCRNLAAAITRIPKLTWTITPATRTLLNDLSSRIPDFLDTVSARELSNVTWAFGKLGYHPGEAVLDAIAVAGMHPIKLHYFQGPTLPLFLWGFAKLGVTYPQLLDAAAPQLLRQLPSLQPHHLTTAAWAYASLQHPHEQLMAALAQKLEEAAHVLSPFHLAGTAWAFAALGGGPDSLF